MSLRGLEASVCAWICVLVPYLCNHREPADEEDGTEDQSKERFVFPQVFGELVRHRGYDGLYGGELGWR